MGEKKLFAVVGSDARQVAAGRALVRAGYAVGGAEQTALADYILLPLPLDADRAGLAGLLRAAKVGALALGGKVSPQAYAVAQAAGVELVDYFAREELTVLNAIPTAEGCIELLLHHTACTLCGTAVLVVGCGHVARALVPRLSALGAQVTVAARSPAQRAWARSTGVATTDTATLRELAPRFGVLVNTVPALLLTQAVLCALPPHSLVIDLASRPGGTDFAAASALGHTALHALSLPAQCAPESAGEYVAHTVLEILAERESSARRGGTEL
jgi:dipicolinate synthase subunit A